MSDINILEEFKNLFDTINKLNYEKIYPILKQLKEYTLNLKSKLTIKKDLLYSKIQLVPSDEQKVIIDAINLNTNIIVDAVAGSGKTTTLIFIAKAFPQKKILQITYNKQLKLEVRDRTIKERVNDNLKIHTYHSLAVRYYNDKANVDQGIIKLIKENMKIRKKDSYDIIVVDEAQDMTPLFYELIQKFLRDINFSDSGLIIMGDRYQGIYNFKNADTRFLSLAEKIYTGKFINLPLKESYRVTKNIATFVNNVMLGYDRILSNKDMDLKVYYCKLNIFSIHCRMVNWIKELLSKGYKPDDIFILAPTIKGTDNNPIKRLENELVNVNIPVYYSRSDDDGLDEEIIKNKVTFTTFHQSKGRERKIVIIYGFDSSYMDFFKKNADPNICPSELYVAVTRAKEILILIDNESKNPLPFLKLNYNEMKKHPYINFIGLPRSNNIIVQESNSTLENVHWISITELIKYISENTMKYLIPLVEDVFKEIDKPKSKNTADVILSVKMDNGLTEDVSSLNGLVIPQLYEEKIKGTNFLNKYINENMDIHDTTIKLIIDKLNEVRHMIKNNLKISASLLMGNIYIAFEEKIHSKLKQTLKYDWLQNSDLDICFKNLERYVLPDVEFEVGLFDKVNNNGKCFYSHVTNKFGIIKISSRADAIDSENLFEFKCTSKLQIEHELQLVGYAWLWKKTLGIDQPLKKFMLLNIRTGECREMIYKDYEIETIMSLLFENKFAEKETKKDEEFINHCLEVNSEVNS